MKILLIPFILLLVPTTAIVYGELSIDTGIAKSLGVVTQHDSDDFYYESGLSSTNKFRIHKVFYGDDQFGNTIRFTYEVPNWSYSIEIWYNQGLISYVEQQRAFDYLVYSDIAKPRF